MLRIGVIGQSGVVDENIMNLAEQVGRAIAEHKAVVLTGGTNGVMEAVSRGAKMAGGLVVGILPGDDAHTANEYVDIPITTGFGFDYRSMVLIHSSDIIIMISGGVGTLVELSSAYMLRKPVIVMESSGGWAERAKDVAYDGLYLDHRRENYRDQLNFAKSPQEAMQIALRIVDEKRMNNGVVSERPRDKIDG